jgi:hypothetical protein
MIKPANMHIRYFSMVAAMQLLFVLCLIATWAEGVIFNSVLVFIFSALSFLFIYKYKKNGAKVMPELRECDAESLNTVIRFRKEDTKVDEFIEKCIILNGYLDEVNFRKSSIMYERNLEIKNKEEARKLAYKLSSKKSLR